MVITMVNEYQNNYYNGYIAKIITMVNIFYNGKFIQWLYYNGFIAVIITVVWFH